MVDNREPERDFADADWFDRFTVEPVSPEEIERRLPESALTTLDIPSHLDRKLATEVETGTALYRLVQLFGTPNVPGVEAGADQRDREKTTWQYLFAVAYDPSEDDRAERREEDVPTEFLLSMYDHKTDLSVGLSAWVDVDRDGRSAPRVGGVHEPVSSATEWPNAVPDADFLVGVVQLALNVTEEPVLATYKQLWV
ncbi:hypothetical protein [Haladaptatus salinisoli]|uniref:hypothetical protein n=1 Tax=Haladaptatus salinisoli TaxID=2884876 RepID=UPI001D0BDD60|nr:hypothetical protein [Haladaptatus salinisoli]